MVWGGPSIISGALFFILKGQAIRECLFIGALFFILLLKGQAIRECLGRVFRESV